MLRVLERIERMNDGVLFMLIFMSVPYLNNVTKADSIFIWYIALVTCIACAIFLIIKHIINIAYLLICGK